MTFLVRVDIYIYIQNNENSFLKIYENQFVSYKEKGIHSKYHLMYFYWALFFLI